jgi:hypothetical protein
MTMQLLKMILSTTKKAHSDFITVKYKLQEGQM